MVAFFPHRVNRVTFSGITFGGAEIWSSGFYHGNAGADCDAPTQAMVDAIATAWQTFFTASTTKIGAEWKTQTVKMVTLNTDGSTDTGSVQYHNYSPSIAGSLNGAHFPPQIALVATMTSPLVRGIGSKGRMYIPGPQYVLDSTGHISATDTGNMKTNFATFLGHCLSPGGSSNVPVLASRGRIVPTPIDGVIKEINGIKIGNVYDTQRRRRNALVEAYQSSALIP